MEQIRRDEDEQLSNKMIYSRKNYIIIIVLKL